MQYNKSFIKPYFIIIMTTAMLYLWQLHLHPIINPDGVTYIQAAAAYIKGGLRAAVAVSDQARWPFYSILIATVHSVTMLSMIAAQRMLDAILICCSACLFLHLVRVFSRHASASFWAIVIWLTWHSYVQWWPTIVRDHGFMTCLLLSFYSYYRYTLTHTWFWALTWALCLVLAEFFRIEAAIYLVLIPIFSLFLTDDCWWRRIIFWFKLNILTLIAAMGLFILFINHTLTLDSFRFDYIWQEFSLFFSTFCSEFMLRYQVVHHSIFYRENNFSMYVLIFAYLFVFMAYILAQLSCVVLPPLLLVKRAWHKLDVVMGRQSFLAYSTIALLIPFFFFMEHVFLNSRYLLPWGIFVLLFVASLLPHVIDSLRDKKKRFFLLLMSLLCVINFSANVFCFGHINTDEFTMGTWLKEHSPNQTIFTNNKGILFYDSAPPSYKNGEVHELWVKGEESTGAQWLRENDTWCDYDLLVLAAPETKIEDQAQLFDWLQRQGAIGPVMKRYKRLFHGGYVMIAPIFLRGCKMMYHHSTM